MWRTMAGAGTLVEHEGRVLMILRHRSGKTRWELPSGLVEARESLEETAVRETLEETAISISLGCLLCTVVMNVPSEEYRAINAYYCASPYGVIVPRPGDNEPIERAEFLNPLVLRPRDIHPVDRRILTRWKKNKNETFYISMDL